MSRTASALRHSCRWLALSVVLASFVLAGTLFTAHPALAQARLPHKAFLFLDTTFTVTATASDSFGWFIFIINPNTNGQPNLLLQVTQTWPSAYDSHPIGIHYNAFFNAWTIINEDQATIPLGTSFNVSIEGSGRSDPLAYLQLTATASNTSGESMFTTYPGPLYPDGGPINYIMVTQDYTGTYNPHEVGVWYDSPRQQWAVFNEDGTPMPIGATFNLEYSSAGVQLIQTVTTSSLLGSYSTIIDAKDSNNLPNMMPQVTEVWNAQGQCGCVIDNHPLGIWYNTHLSKWVIYNVDGGPMPVGAEFWVNLEV